MDGQPPRSPLFPYTPLSRSVEPLRIVGPPVRIDLQFASRAGQTAGVQVRAAQFAMDLAQAVLFVLPQHRLKLRQRVVDAALFARDPPQLEMRVGGFRVYRHRVAETLRGLGVLTPLLVNQPKLVLGVAIVRIDGRSLQHAMKALAAAQSRDRK